MTRVKEGLPTCLDCEKEGLPLTRKATKTGPRSPFLCATHRRARRKGTSESRHETHILSTYNMTKEDYDALYEAQGGRCAVCQWATGKTRRLSVDHDHKCCSGKSSCGLCVRGLLCRPCNTLLGRARDAIEFFQRAIQYLTNPPAKAIMKARLARRKK